MGDGASGEVPVGDAEVVGACEDLDEGGVGGEDLAEEGELLGEGEVFWVLGGHGWYVGDVVEEFTLVGDERGQADCLWGACQRLLVFDGERLLIRMLLLGCVVL